MMGEMRAKIVSWCRPALIISALSFVLILTFQNCGQPVPIDSSNQDSASTGSHTQTSDSVFNPMNLGSSGMPTEASSNNSAGTIASSAGQVTQQPEQWITMNGVLGGSTSANRASVAGNADLLYAWGCTNCTSADKPTFQFGGNCGSSGGGNIDWMTGPIGQFVVPGSAQREGCWLNVTRTVRGAGGVNTGTFYFYWAPKPKLVITMNHVLGGLNYDQRAVVRGGDDLVYTWSCEGCTKMEVPTYRSVCPGLPAAEGVVDWMTGLNGTYTVPGSQARIGCTLDITWRATGPYSESKGVFYYYWSK